MLCRNEYDKTPNSCKVSVWGVVPVRRSRLSCPAGDIPPPIDGERERLCTTLSALLLDYKPPLLRRARAHALSVRR